LIVGGAGGIGSFAVQMAARQGVHVIATARTEDQEYLRSLGASETVDYTRGDVVEAVRASHPGGVDAVLDVVNNPAALAHNAQALRPGGRLLSTVFAVDPAQPDERGIAAVNIVRPQGAEVLDRLGRMVEAGSRSGCLSRRRCPWRRRARRKLVQHGHVRGKVVLRIA